jgi:malonyl-CoA/methylmalonyl-CoA synthetase
MQTQFAAPLVELLASTAVRPVRPVRAAAIARSARVLRDTLLLQGHGDATGGAPAVACACRPGANFLAAQGAAWDAGVPFVPLGLGAPAREWAHVVSDSRARTIVCDDEELADRASGGAGAPKVILLDPGDLDLDDNTRGDNIDDKADVCQTLAQISRLAERDPRATSMIVYTSGTTGVPKGVVYTFDMLRTQAETLSRAWGYTAADRSLLVLPLHHVHGLVNVVQVAVESGATLEVLRGGGFDAGLVWDRLLSRGVFDGAPPITVFNAVPTVYAKLADHAEAAARGGAGGSSSSSSSSSSLAVSPTSSDCFDLRGRVRLAVSGSAALPGAVLDRWRAIAGVPLLERMGMTETGMLLSQPLDEALRVPGTVGTPLPGVSVRLTAEDGRTDAGDGPGSLEVRGRNVFSAYLGREEETRRSFSPDGSWFVTGDVAARDPATNTFSILGRASVDIIKTGGYKVSALEIERAMLEHPQIAECAVVGLPDEAWGQIVAAVIVPKLPTTTTETTKTAGGGGSPIIEAELLRAWCAERLSSYKVPRSIYIRDNLERNAMGKVNKVHLARGLKQ